MREKRITEISKYGKLNSRVLSLEAGEIVLDLKRDYVIEDEDGDIALKNVYCFFASLNNLKVTIDRDFFDKIVDDYIKFRENNDKENGK